MRQGDANRAREGPRFVRRFSCLPPHVVLCCFCFCSPRQPVPAYFVDHVFGCVCTVGRPFGGTTPCHSFVALVFPGGGCKVSTPHLSCTSGRWGRDQLDIAHPACATSSRNDHDICERQWQWPSVNTVCATTKAMCLVVAAVQWYVAEAFPYPRWLLRKNISSSTKGDFVSRPRNVPPSYAVHEGTGR